QAEDGIRDFHVTGVQTCALPIYAVAAALDNPERRVLRAWATRDAAAIMQFPDSVPVTFADVADLGRLVPPDAPHQGVVIEVEPRSEERRVGKDGVAGRRLAQSKT